MKFEAKFSTTNHGLAGGVLISNKQLNITRSWQPFQYVNLLLTWFNFNPSMDKYKVWDEITYPFLYFNGFTVDVYEW